MAQLKLIKIFKRKDVYEDLNRPLKNELTDFVNKTFLKYNHNEIALLKIIYKKIQPILNKYGLFLVFKGGNTMRLVNNNVLKYFPPNSDDIIEKIFQPFLKQSDNDFSIYIYPNIKYYDSMFKRIVFKVFEKLNEIKNELYKHEKKYFNIFTLKKVLYNRLFKELKKELNKIANIKIKNVNLNPSTDKEIYFTKKNDMNADIAVFENVSTNQYIYYNTANFALAFKSHNDNLISFTLLRMKINFEINDTLNLGGELIDISFPNKNDTEYGRLNTTAKYNTFIKENIKKVIDKKNKFTYYIININYMINDLENILFFQRYYPWEDVKYNKRLARLMYFIFLGEIDSKKISIQTIDQIRNDFEIFNNYLLTLKMDKCKKINNLNICVLIKHINKLIYKLPKKEIENFIIFIKRLLFYSNVIISIINEIENYMQGEQKIKDDLYDLNIV